MYIFVYVRIEAASLASIRTARSTGMGSGDHGTGALIFRKERIRQLVQSAFGDLSIFSRMGSIDM